MKPLFRWTTVAVLTASITVAACGGDKPAGAPADSAASTATTTPPAPDSAAATAAPVATVAAVDGQAIYTRCLTCHQATGEGLPGVFPPLAGSEWVNGPASRPIAILIHGLQGEITVKGTKYNNQMMPYGTGAVLNDDEVAAVLTYVRSNFGNTAPAVSSADVAKVRASLASRTTQMTQKDLEALQ